MTSNDEIDAASQSLGKNPSADQQAQAYGLTVCGQ